MFERPILLVPVPTEHDYLREVMIGIGEFVRQHSDWALRRVSIEDEFSDILKDAALRKRIIGVIAFTGERRDENRILKLGVPSVNVSAKRKESKLIRVIPDNEQVGRLAAEHLIGAGIRNLAYVDEPAGYYYSRLRAEGFAKAAAEHGITVAECNDLREKQLGKWLQELPKPVGVMTCHDRIGSQVVDTAQTEELAVPDEVAVVGADDSQVWCATARIALSSVPTEGRRVGFLAARLIQEMNNGRPAPDEPILVAPHRVSARESTDYIPIEDQAVVAGLRYLRNTACQGLTVGQIVEKTGLTRRTFDRQVIAALGRTPHDELERLRLARAIELLIDSDLSNAEIAQRSGFHQPGYFMRVFRQSTGYTPTQYRRKYRSLNPDEE